MAIAITSRLTVIPPSGTLNLPITLQQSLGTNLPSENATIVYQLGDGDVGFDAPGVKTLTKARTVIGPDQSFQDNTTLVGSLSDAILEIQQTLTDQSGSTLTSHCTVNLGDTLNVEREIDAKHQRDAHARHKRRHK